MIRIITLSTATALLALSFGVASAEEHRGDRRMHQVCTKVTKCHREDGRRRCHVETECTMVRDRH